MSNDIILTNVKELYMEYKRFCSDKKSYISLVEWGNKEGFDINIVNEYGAMQMISLSHEDFSALSMLVNRLNLP